VTGVHRIAIGDAPREVLLYAVLGARSWLARLDALLARHVPLDDGGPAPTAPVPGAVAVVLGMLAVRARLLGELDAIAAPAEPEEPAASPLPGWLR